MNLPDLNIWLALCLSKHQFHAAANAWLARQSAAGSVFFCRPTAQGLLRLLTTEGMMQLYNVPAMSNSAAWGVYRGFRADPRIGFADEPAGLEPVWEGFAARSSAAPKLWMDAYLAAFALRSNYLCVTTDKGFKQFKGLNSLVLDRA